VLGQRTFVGRQPIVDRKERVTAYELLFRSSRMATAADFDDAATAGFRVMVNTFASLGIEAVLGNSLGFFNVTREILLSDALEVLPVDRVVIEVLEDIEPDSEVIDRCQQLHEAGFQIALDDWVLDDRRKPLLRWAHIVKVDLPAIPKKDLPRLVRTLRQSGVTLLAEKVETAEEFSTCHALGFDRFQGFYFAKPVVLEGADLDAKKKTLIELLQQINTDAETERIVQSFKHDAELGLNLLRLVNTAGTAARMRLETIEDAIRHLGLRQLGRWVTILLYAQGNESHMRSPLLTSAAHRGRLMELAAGAGAEGASSGALGERAFLVGMLSMADALLGRPIEDLVVELRLGADVARALTLREGDLGELLSMAESIERGDVDKFEPELEHWGLDLASLQRIENESYIWVHGMSLSMQA